MFIKEILKNNLIVINGHAAHKLKQNSAYSIFGKITYKFLMSLSLDLTKILMLIIKLKI